MTEVGIDQSHRQVLADRALDDALDADGFVVVDLLDGGQTSELLKVVEEIYVGERRGFHSTLQSHDIPYRRNVFERIPPLLASAAADLLVDHEPFAASLTVKWPGEDSALVSHQDWTMVDESEHRSVTIWCPLVEVPQAGGGLAVLPGSHRVLDHMRCSPTNPSDFVCEDTLVRIDELSPLVVRPGQAVVFDNGVVHGSGPNMTDTWRPAVSVAYRPAGAQLLHYHVPDPDVPSVDVYEVDPRFFTEMIIGQQPPGEPVRRVPFVGTPFRRDELVARSRRLAKQTGLEGLTGAAPLPWERSVARTMIDDEAERTLEDLGFVVVDVLDQSHVEDLRMMADRLFTDEPVGFHASNMCNDHEYRRAIFDEASGPIGTRVESLFADYEACTAALMLKFPGEGSGFLTHQDWALVDEDHYRSVNVWCPLVDSDEHNGTLRVLPRSHRHLAAVRCDPGFPAGYEAPGWDLPPHDLVPIRVAAGQALVFDHRLLHASGPNLSSEPRPAFTLAMKPRSAAFLHWHLDDPDGRTLSVYSIDPDFMVDFEIGQVPDYPLVRKEVFRPDDLTTEELVQRCGGMREHHADLSSQPSRPEEASLGARLSARRIRDVLLTRRRRGRP